MCGTVAMKKRPPPDPRQPPPPPPCPHPHPPEPHRPPPSSSPQSLARDGYIRACSPGQTGGLRVGRRIRIRVGQQRLYRGEHRGNVVNGTPLVLENVQTNRTIGVNVGMEHFGKEFDHWCFVRVLLCELQLQLEGASFPRCVFRSKYHRMPEHDVVIAGRTGNALGRISLKPLEISH